MSQGQQERVSHPPQQHEKVLPSGTAQVKPSSPVMRRLGEKKDSGRETVLTGEDLGGGTEQGRAGAGGLLSLAQTPRPGRVPGSSSHAGNSVSTHVRKGHVV